MDEMYGLTIKQPWLHAIVAGTKRVENRTWAVPEWVIGKVIALHAGKTYDYGAVFPAWTVTPGWEPGELPEGAVAGVAKVTGCHPLEHVCSPGPHLRACSPWSARSQCHWLLAEVRPLPNPVPCRGMLGLWRLPADVEEAVRQQLEKWPSP